MNDRMGLPFPALDLSVRALALPFNKTIASLCFQSGFKHTASSRIHPARYGSFRQKSVTEIPFS
ncbi:MAG TPA: hypothetical protein DIV39_10290 [Verrucomicrobiales bacterium]|nr:hypothetical protein [Verrucomicrobiales bacterium]